ncbi:MAG: metallophosphoesterase [Flavobacteriaceae bacterium]
MKRLRIKILLFVIPLTVFNGCETKDEIKYSFFVAGHTYGKPGTTKLGLYDMFTTKFDLLNKEKELKFGILTGDIVRKADVPSWDAVDKDLEALSAPVYFARGNHDGNLKFFEKRYGKSYKAFKEGNDIHVILDSNISEWNINGHQLEFLKSILRDLKNIRNIFIYVHHIIWWNETEFYTPYINSRDRMSKNLTFWTELAPLLRSTNKPVFLFAGDVGAFDHKNPKYQSYSFVRRANLTLITSGMGGGKKDNFLIGDVLHDGNVKFRMIHLNGNDINGLGKLEDYKEVGAK